MNITVSADAGVVRMHVAGEPDMATADDLCQALHRAVAQPGTTAIVVDYKRGPQKELYLDTGRRTPPSTPGEQCDEYAFGSTLEGAAHPDWDISVSAVPQRDNSVAGGTAKLVHRRPHPGLGCGSAGADITNDEFYVNIE